MDSTVETLKKKDISSYVDFIKQVFEYDANSEVIEKSLRKNKILVIKKDKRVIASVTVEERIDYVKNQKYYYLGYFGVMQEYRRQGYASKLFDYVEQMVNKNNINYIELTSGNQRRNAHYFYKKNEFKIKDTTVFVKLY